MTRPSQSTNTKISERPVSYQMSQHTAQDIQRVDDLYDTYSIPKISDITGIPESTMCYWCEQGWISTETEHYGQHHKHPDEVIERADTLLDHMPPSAVSDVVDVPVSTIKGWQQKGWISTDKSWKGHSERGNYKVPPMRVVSRVKTTDKKQTEVADEFGICDSTVSRYMRLYRQHKL